MLISQQLRKPSNWQDFEKLCWLLWRSEWKSDDIKLNGRLGQQQNGVDICGHRFGRDGYYGIQCKCKKDGEKLTERDIQTEIERAKSFKPLLKHLILATTAEKDVKIEEFVRVQDEKLRRSGYFSLDVNSWEDIVFLLDQNRSVLNQYLDIVSEENNIIVCFSGNDEILCVEAEHLKVPDPDKYQDFLNEKRKEYAYSAFSFSKEKRLYECNISFFEIKLKIKNEGKATLDDYNLQLLFDQNVAITQTREREYSTRNLIIGQVIPELSFEKNKVMYCPRFSLVPNDEDELPTFYVKAPVGTKELHVKWRLLSRHFRQSGELIIHIKDVIHDFPTDTSSDQMKKWGIVDCIIMREY